MGLFTISPEPLSDADWQPDLGHGMPKQFSGSLADKKSAAEPATALILLPRISRKPGPAAMRTVRVARSFGAAQRL